MNRSLRSRPAPRRPDACLRTCGLLYTFKDRDASAAAAAASSSSERESTRYRVLAKIIITQVRIVDIIGNGSKSDSFSHVIYDPTPTTGSGGFDLEAIAVLYAVD